MENNLPLLNVGGKARMGCYAAFPGTGGAQADRYAEQGATIVTAAVDTAVLAEAVAEQLALVRPT
jgi:2-keto-3-deoxy-L-rhamnonate aldolase RhmA